MENTPCSVVTKVVALAMAICATLTLTACPPNHNHSIAGGNYSVAGDAVTAGTHCLLQVAVAGVVENSLYDKAYAQASGFCEDVILYARVLRQNGNHLTINTAIAAAGCLPGNGGCSDDGELTYDFGDMRWGQLCGSSSVNGQRRCTTLVYNPNYRH